jgi:K+-transporting ATPase ATPase C chain
MEDSVAAADAAPDTRYAGRNGRLALEVWNALAIVLLLGLLCGLVFPLVVVGIGQTLFARQADGSLLRSDQGNVVGSERIGQNFASDRYFHARPSGAGVAGANFGPTNEALFETLTDRANAYRAKNGLPADASLPADAVTTSASGLDPHISPANALLQVKRVARARSLPEADVLALVDRYTESRAFGFLGEPRVNVFLINLALDRGER